ncbi:hypothetical protein [Burkholderia ambifaria]|uniref:hypothetical protein n=2 Tax=Burkholderia ambifaria TaxID=152480 RepID=UPI001588B08E|nr:hypothetical protein [Burkholderia ambifaria]
MGPAFFHMGVAALFSRREQLEFGTAADWQLRQALNALAERAIATVEAKPWLMPAKPVCKPGD